MSLGLWKCFRVETIAEEENYTYEKTEDQESGISSSMSTLEDETVSTMSLPLALERSTYREQTSTTRLTRSFDDINLPGGSKISTYSNPLFCQPPKTIKRKIRLMIAGNHEVGKSCLVMRFLNNGFVSRYNRTTQSVKSVVRRLYKDHYCIQIMDLGGDLCKSCHLSNLYLDGIIFVYATTDKQSLTEVLETCKDIGYSSSSKIPSLVLGNKNDLKGEVPASKGQLVARQIGAAFAEVSAKHGDGVQQVFVELIHRILVQGNVPRHIRKNTL